MNTSTGLLRKCIMIIPTVFLLSFLSFSVLYFAPGNAGKLLLTAKQQRGFISDSQGSQYEKSIGLDKPFGILYVQWATALLKGDFGYSYMTNEPVLSLFISRFSVTFQLAVLAMLIYALVGIPVGMAAAVKENRTIRLIATLSRVVCMSIPAFWLALMLLWCIASYAPFIPIIGYHGIKSLLIPASLMGIMSCPNLTCIVQNKTETVLSKSFVILAGALGTPRKTILLKHVLKNVAAPAIAVSCIDFSGFIGGAILIENIFSISGLGLMLTKAISVKDYSVIAGTLFLLGFFINLFNLAADIAYTALDKRDERNEA